MSVRRHVWQKWRLVVTAATIWQKVAPGTHRCHFCQKWHLTLTGATLGADLPLCPRSAVSSTPTRAPRRTSRRKERRCVLSLLMLPHPAAATASLHTCAHILHSSRVRVCDACACTLRLFPGAHGGGGWGVRLMNVERLRSDTLSVFARSTFVPYIPDSPSIKPRACDACADPRVSSLGAPFPHPPSPIHMPTCVFRTGHVRALLAHLHARRRDQSRNAI